MAILLTNHQKYNLISRHNQNINILYRYIIAIFIKMKGFCRI